MEMQEWLLIKSDTTAKKGRKVKLNRIFSPIIKLRFFKKNIMFLFPLGISIQGFCGTQTNNTWTIVIVSVVLTTTAVLSQLWEENHY